MKPPNSSRQRFNSSTDESESGSEIPNNQNYYSSWEVQYSPPPLYYTSSECELGDEEPNLSTVDSDDSSDHHNPNQGEDKLSDLDDELSHLRKNPPGSSIHESDGLGIIDDQSPRLDPLNSDLNDKAYFDAVKLYDYTCYYDQHGNLQRLPSPSSSSGDESFSDFSNDGCEYRGKLSKDGHSSKNRFYKNKSDNIQSDCHIFKNKSSNTVQLVDHNSCIDPYNGSEANIHEFYEKEIIIEELSEEGDIYSLYCNNPNVGSSSVNKLYRDLSNESQEISNQTKDNISKIKPSASGLNHDNISQANSSDYHGSNSDNNESDVELTGDIFPKNTPSRLIPRNVLNAKPSEQILKFKKKTRAIEHNYCKKSDLLLAVTNLRLSRMHVLKNRYPDGRIPIKEAFMKFSNIRKYKFSNTARRTRIFKGENDSSSSEALEDDIFLLQPGDANAKEFEIAKQAAKYVQEIDPNDYYPSDLDEKYQSYYPHPPYDCLPEPHYSLNNRESVKHCYCSDSSDDSVKQKKNLLDTPQHYSLDEYYDFYEKLYTSVQLDFLTFKEEKPKSCLTQISDSISEKSTLNQTIASEELSSSLSSDHSDIVRRLFIQKQENCCLELWNSLSEPKKKQFQMYKPLHFFDKFDSVTKSKKFSEARDLNLDRKDVNVFYNCYDADGEYEFDENECKLQKRKTKKRIQKDNRKRVDEETDDDNDMEEKEIYIKRKKDKSICNIKIKKRRENKRNDVIQDEIEEGECVDIFDARYNKLIFDIENKNNRKNMKFSQKCDVDIITDLDEEHEKREREKDKVIDEIEKDEYVDIVRQVENKQKRQIENEPDEGEIIDDGYDIDLIKNGITKTVNEINDLKQKNNFRNEFEIKTKNTEADYREYIDKLKNEIQQDLIYFENKNMQQDQSKKEFKIKRRDIVKKYVSEVLSARLKSEKKIKEKNDAAVDEFSPSDKSNLISIDHCLYMSSTPAYPSSNILKTANIKYIILLCHKRGLYPNQHANIEHTEELVGDSSDENVLCLFPKLCNKIMIRVARGESVLVHSSLSNMALSAPVVAAFLLQLNLDKPIPKTWYTGRDDYMTYTLCQFAEKCPSLMMNQGFYHQVYLFNRMDFRMDRTYNLFRYFYFSYFMHNLLSSPARMDIFYISDNQHLLRFYLDQFLQIETDDDRNDDFNNYDWYICRNCSFELCTQLNMVNAEKSSSEGKEQHGRLGKCGAWFVEPLEWMYTIDGALMNQCINCPFCKVVVGYYDLRGFPCSDPFHPYSVCLKHPNRELRVFVLQPDRVKMLSLDPKERLEYDPYLGKHPNIYCSPVIKRPKCLNIPNYLKQHRERRTMEELEQTQLEDAPSLDKLNRLARTRIAIRKPTYEPLFTFNDVKRERCLENIGSWQFDYNYY